MRIFISFYDSTFKKRDLFDMDIIVVSHDAEEIKKLANRVLVISNGRILHDCRPDDFVIG